MTTENEPENISKTTWPPDGSDIIRGIWINVGINICFLILALRPMNSVKKIPLLTIVLVFFNIVFFVIWAAKLQLHKSFAQKKNFYNAEWSLGQFFLRFTKSGLLLTFVAAIIWCILVIIGFDKWYALPMSLAFSYVVFEISCGR